MIKNPLPRPLYRSEQSTTSVPQNLRYCDYRLQDSIESLQREVADLEAYIAHLEHVLTMTEIQRNKYKALVAP